jgi:hypothetical protein
VGVLQSDGALDHANKNQRNSNEALHVEAATLSIPRVEKKERNNQKKKVLGLSALTVVG